MIWANNGKRLEHNILAEQEQTMRKANPVAVALGMVEGPRVTYGPDGGPTKPLPATIKAKNRARNRRSRRSRKEAR